MIGIWTDRYQRRKEAGGMNNKYLKASEAQLELEFESIN
jgi:hypothetical protein